MKMQLMVVFTDEVGSVYVLDMSLCKAITHLYNNALSVDYFHNKIATIKLLRTERPDLSLKAAKEIVESIADQDARVGAIKAAQPKELVT